MRRSIRLEVHGAIPYRTFVYGVLICIAADSWGQENNGHVDFEQWYGGMTALTFQVSIRQHHEITFCIGKNSPYPSSKHDKRCCLSLNKVQGPPSTWSSTTAREGIRRWSCTVFPAPASSHSSKRTSSFPVLRLQPDREYPLKRVSVVWPSQRRHYSVLHSGEPPCFRFSVLFTHRRSYRRLTFVYNHSPAQHTQSVTHFFISRSVVPLLVACHA